MSNLKEWPLIGNKNIVDFLSKSIEKDRVAGSYIFIGNKNLGKASLAKFFAQTLFCESRIKDDKSGLILPCGACQSCKRVRDNETLSDFSSMHSDCYVVKQQEDKSVVTVEQIKNLIVQLSKSSFSGSYKIGIIQDAENMHISASNAFLKAMEEPRDKVVIILIASSLTNIPATVVSRSQIVNFHPVKISTIYDFLIKEYNIKRGKAMDIAHISMGSPALAVKFLQDQDYYEAHIEMANVFVNFFSKNINDRFAGIDSLIKGKTSGQDLVKKVFAIIDIWRGVLRDLYLLNINQNSLIQNRNLFKQLESVRRDNEFILSLLLDLNDAKMQVNSNVNPKFVLNNIASKI